MTKDWKVYAQHILDSIEKIGRIQQRGDILQDDILYDAAIRNLQTLSESTQSMPEVFKANFSNIPWKEISGFRNILVHNYLGNIDPMTIDAVIQQHLPALESCIRTLLKDN
ncbi:MAG: DUF86 domain-containing protein [Cycloclasticus sp.]|nr:DUF86 domain-containing protein [Cycloclasticus sp.]